MLRQPDPSTVLPSQDDDLVTGAATVIGGPVGRHARTGLSRMAPLVIVLLLAGVTLVAGYAEKRPCLGADGYQNERQYTHMCYSDIYPLFWAEKINERAVPYRDHPVEYPVLVGGVMWLSGEVAHATVSTDEGARARRFYFVTVVLLALCAVVLVATTFRLSGRRPWDAVMVAVSPVLAIFAFYNWDLLAAAFAGAGMEAWRRRRPVLAGALWGLGAAAKLYPAFLLVALLPLCLRAGRLRSWLAASAAGVAAWAAMNVPVALLAPEGWRRFYGFSSERTASWHDDSIWYQLAQLTEGSTKGLGKLVHDMLVPQLAAGESPRALNLLTLVLLIAAWSAILVLAWRAPRRPRFPQIAFLVIVAFLFANKVWSPQYALWYLPFGVLALPRWRTFIVWQLTEMLVFGGVMLSLIPLSNPGAGLESKWFFMAVWLRNLVLIFMAGTIIRDIWRPDRDPIRRSGDDDPAGGVLDEAADRGDRIPEPAARVPAFGNA